MNKKPYNYITKIPANKFNVGGIPGATDFSILNSLAPISVSIKCNPKKARLIPGYNALYTSIISRAITSGRNFCI